MARESEITIDISGARGETVAALQDLIEKRAQILYEKWPVDAVIATVITALKSLRAYTRANKTKKMRVNLQRRPKLSVTVEPTSYTVSMRRVGSGRDSVYVIRNPAGHVVDEIRPWWQVPPMPQFRLKAKVFRVTLSEDRLEAWPHQKKVSYLVASDIQSAIGILERRFSKVVRKSSGLAKSALGRAMAQVSDRPAKLEVTNPKAISLLNRVVQVRKETRLVADAFGVSECFIDVEDSLRYAVAALEGGEGVINASLMRAANSIAGYLDHSLDDWKRGLLQRHYGYSKVERPFPESAFDPEFRKG